MLTGGAIINTIAALLASVVANAVDRAYQVWNRFGCKRVVPPIALRPINLLLLHEIAHALMPLFKHSLVKLFEFD